MMGLWCILRTSGRMTMRLAETLNSDGFESWTPVETRSIRKPRMNVRRSVTLPLMPSYVFVRSEHLVDLLEMANCPDRPRRAGAPAHASFSVMHWNDSIPLIADSHLDQLRKLEAKRAPKRKADKPLAKGIDVKVKIEGGSFAGMRGRVERSDEATTLVCFDKRMTVRISTCLLEKSDLCADGIGHDLAKAA